MFKKFTNGCVKLVQRYLPDPFIFCIILTLVVFIAAMPATHSGPLTIVKFWGDGVWSLLGFSMQMALVLVLGTAMANAPAVSRLLKRLAGIPKTPFRAIVMTTVISTIACWLNWGFGLVVGAILAKEIAKQVKKVDYRLLIASAYSGFVVWHAGVSGSIPLQIATASETIATQTSGVVTEAVSTMRTIFSPWNLIICLAVFILMPLVNAAMHPSEEHVISIDPALFEEKQVELPPAETPAQKMEQSVVLSMLVVAVSLAYIIWHFATKGFSLDLNIVNLIFLTLGVFFHRTPINYVHAINDAVKGAGGVLLQFPFYAGIMGIMTGMNADRVSLAGVISTGFVAISNHVTFPLWTFLSAGVVNFFVPSGGGQWAVQAPIMMPAGAALNVDPAVTSMAIAWGDAWTNMLQPFWALPALGIAKLGARDIMGYCVIDLLLTGIIVCVGFGVVGFLF